MAAVARIRSVGCTDYLMLVVPVVERTAARRWKTYSPGERIWRVEDLAKRESGWHSCDEVRGWLRCGDDYCRLSLPEVAAVDLEAGAA